MEVVTRPSKRELFNDLYSEESASVHLDARRPGVVLPEPCRDVNRLVIQYGEHFIIPVRDLVVTDEGISATLMFSGQMFATFVPWSAVYVITNSEGRGICYEEDVPPDVDLVGSLRPRPDPSTMS